MEMPLKVLLIEDREEDALLLERELKRGGLFPRCIRIETEDALRQKLHDESWDVLIADYSLPQFDGLKAFCVFREVGIDIPFIIVSGSIGEEVAVMAMKAGIHDYVMKDNLARLVPAIQRELRDAAERRARREAETRLRDTERLRTIGELTASLIHDLKNPLQSILSSSELLNKSNITTERRVKFCGLIERQVNRVLAMSEEVLEYVRGCIRLNLEPTPLGSLVSEIVDTYEGVFAKAGITLTCSFDRCETPDTCIACDRRHIWRALQNLVNNAKDATPVGGNITLRVSSSTSHVVIDVSDTGSGIPETVRQRVFEPFVTHGKKHGTGLGLSIVKNIIDAHNGVISFESEIGFGTTFRIKLPSSPQAVIDSRNATMSKERKLPDPVSC